MVLIFFEDVAHSDQGIDQLGFKIAIDFFPEKVDINLYNIRSCIEIDIPYLFGDINFTNYPALIPKKVLQENKFPCS